jgi:predicted dehydrogenase
MYIRTSEAATTHIGEEMKSVVVGLGKMGQDYIAKLRELMFPINRIIGVDIAAARTYATEKKHPGIEVYHGLGDWLRDVKMAIVATNTPSHCQVVEKLLSVGVGWVLCEKPIGMDVSEFRRLQQSINETGAQVFIALLSSFSEVLAKVIALMEKENLLVTEGSILWTKNRYGDPRPTTGNLKEETVHGVTILHTLCGIHQHIQEIRVAGALSYPHYTEPVAQQKARALNPAFPLKVNASTMVIERIRTDRTEVVCNLHSSFIQSDRTRYVTLILARVDDPLHPLYAVKLQFNIQHKDTEVDTLTVRRLATDSVKETQCSTDKLREQTSAFVTAALGGLPDKRLTPFSTAMNAIAFIEAVSASDREGRFVVVE